MKLEARDAAQLARQRVADGQHLTVMRRVQKAKKPRCLASTFDAVAADWVEREARRLRWTPAYRFEVASSLRNHPRDLDTLPMTEVSAAGGGADLTAYREERPTWP